MKDFAYGRLFHAPRAMWYIHRSEELHVREKATMTPIEQLTIPERLELIGQLWDSIIEADPNVPVPDWHLRELEKRRAAAEANPEAGIPWELVKARLTRPS